MSKFYSISALCQLTSVSVRTLHYYDEINILKPKKRTAKGHRYYDENDLMRLQQIVTLKFLGLPLLQIKKIFENEKYNIFDSLKMQAKALADEKKKIEKAADFLNYLINEHQSKKTIDWNTVTDIILTLKLPEMDSNSWYEKFLTPIETLQVKKIENTRIEQWEALLQEVKKHMLTDPNGTHSTKLAHKVLALANTTYGSYPGLSLKLWEAYKQGNIPQNKLPYEKDVIAYLSKGFEKIAQQNEIGG